MLVIVLHVGRLKCMKYSDLPMHKQDFYLLTFKQLLGFAKM